MRFSTDLFFTVFLKFDFFFNFTSFACRALDRSTSRSAASAVRQRLRAQASCLGIMSRTVRRHSWLLPTVPRVVEAADDVAPPLLALTVMRTLIIESCGKATTRKCNGWRRFSLECRLSLPCCGCVCTQTQPQA